MQAISEFHWYVSAYHLSFEDFGKGGITGPLCKDEDSSASMFRVVFKSNLTLVLAEDLFRRISDIMEHVKRMAEAEAKAPKLDGTIRAITSIRRSMVMHNDEMRRKSQKNFNPCSNGHAPC